MGDWILSLSGCGNTGTSVGLVIVGPITDSVSVAGVLATGEMVRDRSPLERPLGREVVAEELSLLTRLYACQPQH